MCVDYVLPPNAIFTGRYSMALVQAEPTFVSALESLKDAVRDLPAPPPATADPRLYRRGPWAASTSS